MEVVGRDLADDLLGWTRDEELLEDEDHRQHTCRERLASEVLRQLLEGLAYCHSCGIVHRDIKPANMPAVWIPGRPHKLGYRGENKGPRSILYCAPEEFVNEEYPYAFDMYGVAITWIRLVLSEDGHPCNDGMQSRGLGNEDALFQWRMDVRNFLVTNLVAWEEYATLHDTLPHGWDDLFGSTRRGIHALRLLSNMMSYSPRERMSAAEALVGAYLNPECDAQPPPRAAPGNHAVLTDVAHPSVEERKGGSLR